MNISIKKDHIVWVACSFVVFSSITTAHAKDLGTPVSADQALILLKSGNRRFTTQKTRTDGLSKTDVQRLSKAQAPNSIVLSCSDSRVPPELVFDQKLGELFTVRTAGESLSPEVIGSIEFAVANLGSHLIVVLGHSNCGAVKAAVETIGGKSAGSDNLDRLVADLRPRIRPSLKLGQPSTDLKSESWANARGAAKALLEKSQIIADATKSQKVKIVVGLYDLSNGLVEFEQL